MKITYYGGQTAGVVGLLTLLASKSQVVTVIPEDEGVRAIAEVFNIPIKEKNLLNTKECISEMKEKSDVFFCCHGRKILSEAFVSSIPCINIHPCLYSYKGAKPIKRLIEDNNPKASVAAHYMVAEVDAGKTIVEYFKTIEEITTKTESQVYNELYPLYTKVILKTLQSL